MNIVFNYFFNGNDPSLWLVSKLVMSFVGGIATYLMQNQYFVQPGIKKLSIKEGWIFSFFSSVGGIALLQPTNAANAFAAGLIGVAAMSNFITRYNEGATEKKYSNKILSRNEIMELKKHEK